MWMVRASPRYGLLLYIVDSNDKRWTSQVVRWGTKQELEQFRTAVALLVGCS